MEKVTIADINKLLGVDGKAISALEIVEKRDKETLVKILTFIITKLEN